jgi:hypothetical protein
MFELAIGFRYVKRCYCLSASKPDIRGKPGGKFFICRGLGALAGLAMIVAPHLLFKKNKKMVFDKSLVSPSTTLKVTILGYLFGLTTKAQRHKLISFISRKQPFDSAQGDHQKALQSFSHLNLTFAESPEANSSFAEDLEHWQD